MVGGERNCTKKCFPTHYLHNCPAPTLTPQLFVICAVFFKTRFVLAFWVDLMVVERNSFQDHISVGLISAWFRLLICMSNKFSVEL